MLKHIGTIIAGIAVVLTLSSSAASAVDNSTSKPALDFGTTTVPAKPVVAPPTTVAPKPAPTVPPTVPPTTQHVQKPGPTPTSVPTKPVAKPGPKLVSKVQPVQTADVSDTTVPETVVEESTNETPCNTCPCNCCSKEGSSTTTIVIHEKNDLAEWILGCLIAFLLAVGLAVVARKLVAAKRNKQ